MEGETDTTEDGVRLWAVVDTVAGVGEEAAQYAELAGRPLGRVVSVNEDVEGGVIAFHRSHRALIGSAVSRSPKASERFPV
ncbi:hypothetical protein ACTWPT_02560 [Nonomuraea sp. 3N208]|uniref:hypothetical protein n=1 Tax=Nonomuraea sp. 3N208 TaxID=3457421 RepID=UPI003FCC5B06